MKMESKRPRTLCQKGLCQLTFQSQAQPDVHFGPNLPAVGPQTNRRYLIIAIWLLYAVPARYWNSSQNTPEGYLYDVVQAQIPAHRYLISLFAYLSVLSGYLWHEFAVCDEVLWAAIVAILLWVGSHQAAHRSGHIQTPSGR